MDAEYRYTRKKRTIKKGRAKIIRCWVGILKLKCYVLGNRLQIGKRIRIRKIAIIII